MIFIGLDISKNSTALCINNNNNINLYSYTTKKSNNIWIKKTKDIINYKNINYTYKNEKDYSQRELIKLNEFDSITNLIIKDIFDNIKNNKNIKISIEGYSYNSKGPIFDLIEYSTILKFKLMEKISKNEIIIISPLTLKTNCCKMVYKPRIEIKGKRIIKEILHHENTKGKQATKFDKWDMFYALIESKLNMKLKTWCENNINDITKVKDVPKPLDDMVDAIFLMEIIKNGG